MKYKLIDEILVRSKAAAWADAKLEWLLHEIYTTHEPQACLCGHFPIVEICVLKNKENQRRARVGNCCVKKFMGLPSHLIFQAIKRVNNDRGKSLNLASLDYAKSKLWINTWDYEFYLKVMRKRILTQRQKVKKYLINDKVLVLFQQSSQYIAK